MDVKGGSWVSGMYQKFEAMCAEMEEDVYEDTFKYVENQVRAVGETVKKFYSDVIQDLHHPSSLDSLNSGDPLMTVIYHGDDKICRNLKPIGNACEKTKDFNGDDACDDNIKYGSCDSAIGSVIKPCESTPNHSSDDKCVKVNSQSHDSELALSNRSTFAARKDSQNCLSNLTNIIATVSNNYEEEVTYIAPHNESDEPSSVHREAYLMKASKVSDNDNGEGISREMIEGYECGVVVKDKKTQVLSGGHLNKTSSPFIACEFKICDADKQETPIGKQLNQVKLEDSCVLVEKNDNSSVSAREHVQISYKKKIQDVFSPRRWSKGKQDQEQLAVWYEEQSGRNFSTSMMQSEISESFESDWELL